VIAVEGDSLTVGAERYLPAEYRVDARVGRTSAQGLYRVRHKLKPNVFLVWALGTNDGGRVVRPPRRARVLVTLYGVSHARRYNDLIHRSVPDRCIVHWGRWARRHRSHMTGVHGDAVAYRARARMTVRAVRVCR
jgi:hypothetical protein